MHNKNKPGKKPLTYQELETSNRYWFENFSQKSKQIDNLCVQTAQRLGKIDFEIWRDSNPSVKKKLIVFFKRKLRLYY